MARRVVPRAAALALLLVTATACSTDEWARGGMPESASRQGDIVQTLWNGSWIAALATGGVVWGLIIWACIFHRKKRRSNQELPPQVRYNLPIEILYTVVPVIMVSVLFYFTARDQNEITRLTPNPDVVVNVEAFQWSWRFTTEYQGQTATEVGVPVEDYNKGPQLVLPVDSRIRFKLHTDDVIHSFWVPAFLFKLDVIPGVENEFELDTLNKPGVYAGRCAELCGVDHSRMLFNVKLVSKDEFAQYMSSKAGSAQ